MKDSDSERSNLLVDEELALKFNKHALIVARDLRKKYYSVFSYITEDDLLNECWDKIARQNIGYDSSKGCKFETFVRMLVTNRCIDMSRKHTKLEGVLSLDKNISSDDSEDGCVTLLEFIEDVKGMEDSDFYEIDSVIDSCNYDFKKSNLKFIYERKKEGYSDSEIAKELNVKVSTVKNILNDMKPVFMSRLYGNCKTLEEVLYGDESYLVENKLTLLNTLSYVSDDSGISLSETVDMVIEGKTYKQIQNTLGVSVDTIKNFLNKYMNLRIAL